MRKESQDKPAGWGPGRARPPMPSSVRVPDYWRIDLAQPWQVRFWTREFGVTEGELRDALREAGDQVGEVRARLEGR
jgi:hypothetical protein